MRMSNKFCNDFCCPPKVLVEWESYDVKVSRLFGAGLELDQFLTRLIEDQVDYSVTFK